MPRCPGDIEGSTWRRRRSTVTLGSCTPEVLGEGPPYDLRHSHSVGIRALDRFRPAVQGKGRHLNGCPPAIRGPGGRALGTASGGSDLVGACWNRPVPVLSDHPIAPCPPCKLQPEDGHDHHDINDVARHRRRRHPPRSARRGRGRPGRRRTRHGIFPHHVCWAEEAAPLAAELR